MKKVNEVEIVLIVITLMFQLCNTTYTTIIIIFLVILYAVKIV